MKGLKTSPALVPPPPVPPAGRVAAASPEPSREPSRSFAATSFWGDVLFELRLVVWPDKRKVCASSAVTFGLLCFFSLYICSLDAAAHAIFHTLGLYAKS